MIYADNELVTISVDPGTNQAGFSVIAMDFDELSFRVIRSSTISGPDCLRRYSGLVNEQEPRYLRNVGYRDVMKDWLEIYTPHTVACEAAFSARLPAVFKALTEQITMFRVAMWEWDRSKPLHLYPPSEVKKSMRVKGTSGDKNLMLESLKKRTDLHLSEGMSLDDLSEHAIDSICIGLHHLNLQYEQYKQQILWCKESTREKRRSQC